MSNNYAGLRFSFAKTEQEIEGMAGLARKFPTRDCPERIEEWKRMLITFRSSSGPPSFEWQISESDALRTKPSDGGYERGKRHGGLRVAGLLSSVWEIHRLPKADKQWNTHFLLNGKASTSIRVVVDSNPSTVLKAWHCDIGNKDSPGCHFHVQCENSSVLPVPRHPAMLVTPMDALEFLIAELFQDEWERHVSTHAQTALWAVHQRRRLSAFLRWQKDCIDELSGSPWTSFKGAKPPAELFAQ